MKYTPTINSTTMSKTHLYFSSFLHTFCWRNNRTENPIVETVISDPSDYTNNLIE